MRPRIGALFTAGRSIAELPAAAGHAERLGLEELWLVEDCFAYGGVAAAATVLAHTARLSAGIGLLPALARNPAIAAMELATLAELHPGRLQMAFGHGVRAWMDQIGIAPADRVAALREVLVAVRGLLAGETRSVDGRDVTLRSVRLDAAPRHPPELLVGTTGPRGIALAAEHADGLLLPEGASAEAIAAARRTLGPGKTIVTYAWLRVDDDAEAAHRPVREVVDRWRTANLYPHLLAQGGLPADGPLQPADLDRVAVVGTPAQCAQALLRLGAAGATTVVLMPVGDGHAGQLERVVHEVLPLLPVGP